MKHPKALLALALAACALGGCVMALVDGLTGAGEAREIRAIGVAAQALVLEIWDTGVTVNNDPVVGFRLEVYPPDRPPYEAVTKALISRLDIPQIQPGAMLPVKFDPEDPQRVAIGADGADEGDEG